MPFTLAHPAAVLPWHRSRTLPLLGLAAGSVAPDLPYFLPAPLGGHFHAGHQLFFGAALLSPALGLLLVALLLLLRQPTLHMLWGRHRLLAGELLALGPGGRLAPLRLLAAVYLGVALHLLWDHCTHDYGWPVRHLAWLRAPVPLPGRTVALYTLAQWSSSVLGVGVLAMWYRLRLAAIAPPAAAARDGFRRRAVALTLVVVALLYGLAQAVHPRQAYASIHGRVYLASTAATSFFLLSWWSAGLLRMLRRR